MIFHDKITDNNINEIKTKSYETFKMAQSLKKALIHRCIQIETRNGERMDF